MIYSDNEIIPSTLEFNEVNIPVYTFDTIIVGSGAAGLGAANSLLSMGHGNIAVITESMKSGTSKNSGANNQTYYKISMQSERENADSVRIMAKDLYGGLSMDGDIALMQAALSARCFYRLADLGVDFTQNIYGEFAEYSKSNDGGFARIADAGFFTAKKIADAAERNILSKNIPVFNRFRVVSVIKTKSAEKSAKTEENAVGILAIDKDMQRIYAEEIEEYNLHTRIKNANKNIFGKIQERLNSSNVNANSKSNKKIGIVKYQEAADNLPEIEKPSGNEFGYVLFKASNIIYAVGGPAGIYDDSTHLYPQNMTCSFGAAFFAGVKGKNLTETIFAESYISPDNNFKWKIEGDLLDVSPRRFSTEQDGKTFLDYTGEPCKNLIKINYDLYKLFSDNGIDLSKEPLEVKTCAYHLNGGLNCDIYSESNIKHFFPVGEAAAVFGTNVPDGASLAATQITAFRAAEKIAKYYKEYNAAPMDIQDFGAVSADEVNKYIAVARHLLKNAVKNIVSENVPEMRKKYQKRFSNCCMNIRSLENITLAVGDCRFDIANFINDNKIDDITYLSDVFENHDILITQYVFLQAVRHYILSGGKSRGTYIIAGKETETNLEDPGSATTNSTNFDNLVSFVKIKNVNTLEIDFTKRKVKDIPE